MRRWLVVLWLTSIASLPLCAQRPDSLGPTVRKYLRVSTPRVILEHVEIIDGTGAAPSADRNITIERGRITAISAGVDQAPSDGTTVLDLRGYSVMPGIVGMHEHLMYLARTNLAPDFSSDGPAVFLEMPYSAPRLYLANGVTTARTAGSIEPATDVRIKEAIEAGTMPGPHLDVTGPYLDGASDLANLEIRHLTGPEDARQTVAYWADRGVTSFKAYTHITREEMAAAIKEAHKRGLKVTGHLCSVTYAEAAESGHRQSRARFLRQHRARSRQEAGHVQREQRRLHARAHDAGERRGGPVDRDAPQASCGDHFDHAGYRSDGAGARIAVG